MVRQRPVAEQAAVQRRQRRDQLRHQRSERALHAGTLQLPRQAKDAVDRVFEALKNFMTSAMEMHSIAISAEIRDIDAALSPKFGNVRDHLKDKA